jgi:hypothetical protein
MDEIVKMKRLKKGAHDGIIDSMTYLLLVLVVTCA